MEPIIKIEHMKKVYADNGFTVLKDITVDINRGDVISIIGPSGTGKSTFIRCLNQLEKITDGRVIVDGVDVTDKKCDVALLRRKMGMVFQSFNLYDHLSVIDNITLAPIKILGKTKAEAEARGMELLDIVGLASKRDAMPSQLSGGQKQRIAIARTLAMDPEIILFDEPTSALDPTMVSEVLGVIRRLAQTGITMLIVTHEMNFARDVSNRVFYMDQGYIWEDGTPDQIFNHPQKNETRVFINRIRGLHFELTNRQYDLYAYNGQIEALGAKYFLTEKQIRTLVHLTEELLLVMDPDKGVSIDVECSEKDGSLGIRAVQRGCGASLLSAENVDDFAVALIRGYCKSVEETVGQDSVTLTLALK